MKFPPLETVPHCELKKFLPIVFIISILSFLGCYQPVKDPFHTAYFNPALKIVDSFFDSSLPDSAMLHLMTSYAQAPAIGIGDLAEKYKRLTEYYTNTKKDVSLAIRYADSNINLLAAHTSDKQLAALYAHALLQKGNVYLAINKYDEAIENYNRSKLVIIQKLGENDCAMWTYYESMANLFFAQGNDAKALENFKKRYALIQHCFAGFMKFKYTQADLDNMGICFSDLGNLDSALYYFRAAMDFIEKEKDSFPDKKQFIENAQLVIYKNAAFAAYNMKDIKTGEEYANKGLDSSVKYHDGLESTFRFLLFYQYIQNKDFKKAQHVYLMLQRIYNDNLKNYSADMAYFYQVANYYFVSIKDTGAAYRAMQKYQLVKDSVERRDKQFASLDLKKEFEYKDQKIINESLQKDNKLKNVYLWLTIVSLLLGFTITAFILLGLYRSRIHVKKLNELNAQVIEQNTDLRNTLISLEQSHDENARIIRVVAHDLLNPIAGIRNIAHSLFKNEVSNARKELLTLINDTCTHSLVLIRELLSEKNRLTLAAKEKVDVKRLLEQSVEFLQARADEKNQRLSLQAQPLIMHANRQKIWRVFSNIINNSIKYSPPNSVIEVKLNAQKKAALFSVKDSGIGIPEELHEKLFVISSDKQRKGTSGEESHGLGLSIVHKIVTEHNGKIWFDSKIGVGSTFYIELPVTDS